MSMNFIQMKKSKILVQFEFAWKKSATREATRASSYFRTRRFKKNMCHPNLPYFAKKKVEPLCISAIRKTSITYAAINFFEIYVFFRSVYSRADIYLLDDPLSALDVRVARYVNQYCIRGLLREKCVILVTHQLHFLREGATEVMFVDTGRILRCGTFTDVCGQGRPVRNEKEFNYFDLDGENLNEKLEPWTILRHRNELKVVPSTNFEEIKRQGSIKWKFITSTLSMGNSGIFLAVLALLLIISTVIQFASDIWLKKWWALLLI